MSYPHVSVCARVVYGIEISGKDSRGSPQRGGALLAESIVKIVEIYGFDFCKHRLLRDVRVRGVCGFVERGQVADERYTCRGMFVTGSAVGTLTSIVKVGMDDGTPAYDVGMDEHGRTCEVRQEYPQKGIRYCSS